VRDAAAATPVAGDPWRISGPPAVTPTDLADRTLIDLPPAPTPFDTWVVTALCLPMAIAAALVGAVPLREGERTPSAIFAAGLGLLVGYGVVALGTRYGERIVHVEASAAGIRLVTWRPLLPGRALFLSARAGWSVGGSVELRRAAPARYVLTLSPGGLSLGDKVVFDDADLGAWLDGALTAWRQRVPRA
jgi:hypothetical protein